MIDPPPTPPPVIGVDRPAKPGADKPPWWFYVIAAVLGIAVIAALVDFIIESEEEKVAKQVKAYFVAFADSDGAAFCEVLTPDAQQEVIDSSIGIPAAGDDCASNADFQFEQLAKLDDPRLEDIEEAGDIDESDIADAIEIDGDTARIDADDAFVSNSIVLAEVDGEWLVTEESFGTSVVDPNGEGGPDEVRDAADRLCAAALSDRGIAIDGLIDASGTGEATEFRAAKRDLVEGEEALLNELQELADTSGEPSLDDLIEAQGSVVRSTEDLTTDGAAFDDLVTSYGDFSQLAKDQGFQEIGCAVPLAG